jgi:hypothetical protein
MSHFAASSGLVNPRRRFRPGVHPGRVSLPRWPGPFRAVTLVWPNEPTGFGDSSDFSYPMKISDGQEN